MATNTALSHSTETARDVSSSTSSVSTPATPALLVFDNGSITDLVINIDTCIVRAQGEFLHDATCNETLVEFTRRLCSMNVYSLFFDYATVITNDMKEPSTVGDQHPTLNRFKDVRCLDHTRVKVPTKDDSGEHDFINANYVDGFREEKKFILAQSPMGTTVESFWKMIYQERCVIVISLISLDKQSCDPYIPLKRTQTIRIGPFAIKNAGTQQIREQYDATILMVQKGDEVERKLLHICYFAWPNKGTPTKPTEFLYLITDVNYNRRVLVDEAEKAGWIRPGEQSPIVVHCLTGAGRGGTFAALDIICRKMDFTEKLPNGPLVDVKDTVMRIRTQRDMAVLKPEQYVFLHLMVVEYALRQKYYDDIDFIDLSNYTNSEQ